MPAVVHVIGVGSKHYSEGVPFGTFLGREGRNRGRVRGRLLLYRLDRYSRGVQFGQFYRVRNLRTFFLSLTATGFNFITV